MTKKEHRFSFTEKEKFKKKAKKWWFFAKKKKKIAKQKKGKSDFSDEKESFGKENEIFS